MSAPEPLTGPKCDLRDFAFMPLDVRPLLTSETWIEAADDPKLGHALICLWCESWHQIPAGSLPDKDGILARLAMCHPDEWSRVRDRALQGWVDAPMAGCITRSSPRRPWSPWSESSRIAG